MKFWMKQNVCQSQTVWSTQSSHNSTSILMFTELWPFWAIVLHSVGTLHTFGENFSYHILRSTSNRWKKMMFRALNVATIVACFHGWEAQRQKGLASNSRRTFPTAVSQQCLQIFSHSSTANPQLWGMSPWNLSDLHGAHKLKRTAFMDSSIHMWWQSLDFNTPLWHHEILW